MNAPLVVSVREQPECADKAMAYLQSKWPQVSPLVYEDCVRHCLGSSSPLPQWYLLRLGDAVIGCAGLVPNDFISRMDLWPWICALHVEQERRGHAYGALLLERCKRDAAGFGLDNVYLATDHTGYYERYGFSYLARGFHPDGGHSRIYVCPVR